MTIFMASKKQQLDEEQKQQREKSQISFQVFYFILFFFFGFFDDFLCFLLLLMFSFLRSKFAQAGTMRKGPDQGRMRDRGQRATNVEQQDFYGFMGPGMTSLLVHPWAGPAMLFLLPLSHSVCK